MSLPAIPEPSTLDVASIATLGAEVLAWAESTDDIAAVRDAAARWGAITEYVRRTSREGVAEAEAALRRLEVRVASLVADKRAAGELAVNGGDRSVAMPTLHDLGISRQEAADFRLMAEHADVVEAVIAASDDASPPSRRKVLTEIARRQDVAADVETAAEMERVAPRILAALATMPATVEPDWLVTLRFRNLHINDVRMVLPDDAEVLSIEEVAQ